MDPHATITNWQGQLGIIFTHELLHLWVPNALQLQGDYDWFFEGFTLYTALVTALELKFINLNEYLATLARVYDAYLSRPDELSLIDASERRWTTGNAGGASVRPGDQKRVRRENVAGEFLQTTLRQSGNSARERK
jgi:predicted metalloprotease with PDZ domain